MVVDILFETTVVLESVGSVEVCAIVTTVPPGGAECDIEVSFAFMNGAKAGACNQYKYM